MFKTHKSTLKKGKPLIKYSKTTMGKTASSLTLMIPDPNLIDIFSCQILKLGKTWFSVNLSFRLWNY